MGGENPYNRPFLPEIVEEILLNLPVKSLTRFRCVSKYWQSLISDNRFVRKHLSRGGASTADSLCRQRLILNTLEGKYNENLYCVPLSPLPTMPTISAGGGGYLLGPESYCQLVASCDGLLCVRVGKSVRIWNPFLKNCVRTIMISKDQTSKSFCAFGGSTVFFELGYVSMRDDYKLFGLFPHRTNTTTYKTQIYSFKIDDSWREHENFPQDYRPLSTAFANGSIHCLAFRKIPGSLTHQFALFSFDLSSDSNDSKYMQVPLPEYWPIPPYPKYIKVCNLRGMLCVLVNCNSCLVLWAMKDRRDHKSWTKILHIPFELVFNMPETPTDIFMWKAFYLYQNGEVLMGVVSQQRTELLRCKYNTVMLRETIFHSPSLIQHGFVHVESLISAQKKLN